MPAWLTVVLIVLTAYRLTRLVTADELLADARDRFVARHDHKLGYVAGCPFCLSIYAAAIVTAATWGALEIWGDGLPAPVLVGAGAAGAVSLLYEVLPEQ